jgi:hypothetical protein
VSGVSSTLFKGSGGSRGQEGHPHSGVDVGGWHETQWWQSADKARGRRVREGGRAGGSLGHVPTLTGESRS